MAWIRPSDPNEEYTVVPAIPDDGTAIHSESGFCYDTTHECHENAESVNDLQTAIVAGEITPRMLTASIVAKRSKGVIAMSCSMQPDDFEKQPSSFLIADWTLLDELTTTFADFGKEATSALALQAVALPFMPSRLR